MENVNEILNQSSQEAITFLMQKSIIVPSWTKLVNEYDTNNHPVMDKMIYPDIVSTDGIEYVTRIPLDLIKVTVKRMTELVCGIPVKRIYKPQNDRQKEVVLVIENIYQRNRIDAVNVERLNMLFAGCEVATVWYGIEERNELYGISSPIKLRCYNYSPMRGDKLYPLFDEYGDMIAMSFWYQRIVNNTTETYFDTYTATEHIRWTNDSTGWKEIERENISIGKIPAIYMYRPSPIWENNASLVYEMEWALSRNGNYLRRNSKPLFVVFADEDINYGQEKSQDKEFRTILQYPSGSNAQYVTWTQAIENLKFYVQELRQQYFSSLQMPDFSMDNMKTTPMSGEARKMVFLDAQLKVRDESGRILEFFDRETNVLKSFAKIIMPSYSADIDALQVETLITPYQINDESETIQNLVTATGGKQIVSQREAIEVLGWSEDPEKTLRQISEENTQDSFNLTV